MTLTDRLFPFRTARVRVDECFKGLSFLSDYEGRISPVDLFCVNINGTFGSRNLFRTIN